MELKDALNGKHGIKAIEINILDEATLSKVFKSIEDSHVTALEIDNHFNLITDGSGKVVDKIFTEQIITFKMRKG